MIEGADCLFALYHSKSQGSGCGKDRFAAIIASDFLIVMAEVGLLVCQMPYDKGRTMIRFCD